MTKIIAFSGQIGSGKTTCARVVVGEIMKSAKMIEKYTIREEDGELLIPSSKATSGWGVFSIESLNEEFLGWCEQNLWSRVKWYGFADSLKRDLMMGYFGLPSNRVYGTQEQKQSFIPGLTYAELLKNVPITLGYGVNKKCSGRTLMQDIATIIRNVNPDAFVEKCIKNIKEDSPVTALIVDCRFRNEVEALRHEGASIIRLLGKEKKDKHYGELELDSMPDSTFDMVLPHHLSYEEKNNQIKLFLKEQGIIE